MLYYSLSSKHVTHLTNATYTLYVRISDILQQTLIITYLSKNSIHFVANPDYKFYIKHTIDQRTTPNHKSYVKYITCFTFNTNYNRHVVHFYETVLNCSFFFTTHFRQLPYTLMLMCCVVSHRSRPSPVVIRYDRTPTGTVRLSVSESYTNFQLTERHWTFVQCLSVNTCGYKFNRGYEISPYSMSVVASLVLSRLFLSRVFDPILTLTRFTAVHYSHSQRVP